MSEIRALKRRSTIRAIAAMLAGLKAAEEISRDIAQRQASLASDAKMRRFFAHQAVQEAAHARIFDIALGVVSPHARCPDPLARALAAFRSRVGADLDAARLGESIVGLQGVFEALGEAALRPAQGGIAAFAARFVPMRGVLLEQERMHRRYGRYWLARMTAADGRARAWLPRIHDDYVAHGEAVLAASLEIFDAFPLDQQRYLSDGLAAMRTLDDDVSIGGTGSTSAN